MRKVSIEIKEVDKNDYIDSKFHSCDTCDNAIMTKWGIQCSKNLARVCKPGLLENPKYYIFNGLND